MNKYINQQYIAKHSFFRSDDIDKISEDKLEKTWFKNICKKKPHIQLFTLKQSLWLTFFCLTWNKQVVPAPAPASVCPWEQRNGWAVIHSHNLTSPQLTIKN